MRPPDVPAELRALRRFLVWRYEDVAGRRTKVPYQAGAPARRARSTDPRTWAPFATAAATVARGAVDGVGIALGDGLVGVDLDAVRDGVTGALTAPAQRIVTTLDSYTEVSPSGTGLHVLCRGALPPGRRRRGGVELYDGARFFTLTGRHVVGTPRRLGERTAELAALHRRVFGSAPEAARSPARPAPVRPIVGEDAPLLLRAQRARNGAKFRALWHGDVTGYRSSSEADLALCSLLAFWTGGDAARVDRLFRASGLMRAKWDTPRGDATYGARTIACALGGRR